MVELLIVVVLLGIIASFVLPTLQSGMAASKLSRAAGEVVAALEYARLNAMSTGTQTKVTIDDTADSILVEKFKVNGDLFGGGDEMSEGDIENGTFQTMEKPMDRGKDYNISFPGEDRFTGVDITSSVFGAGNFVTFQALGSPSTGGAVTLSLSSSQITVTVDDLTGKVTTNE